MARRKPDRRRVHGADPEPRRRGRGSAPGWPSKSAHSSEERRDVVRQSLRAAVAAEEEAGTSRKDAIRAVATRAAGPKRTVYDAVHGVGEGA